MADPLVQQQISVTIPAGVSGISGAVPLGDKTLVGIVIPANWVTASLSFQASADDTNFGELLDSTATAIAITSVTGGALVVIALDPTKWRGVRTIKVRSGTSAAPVNQTNSPVLTLLTRDVF